MPGQITFGTYKPKYVGLPLDDIKYVQGELNKSYDTNREGFGLLNLWVKNVEVDPTDEPVTRDVLDYLTKGINDVALSGNWEHAKYVVADLTKYVQSNDSLKTAIGNKASKDKQRATLKDLISKGYDATLYKYYMEELDNYKGIGEPDKYGVYKPFVPEDIISTPDFKTFATQLAGIVDMDITDGGLAPYWEGATPTQRLLGIAPTLKHTKTGIRSKAKIYKDIINAAKNDPAMSAYFNKLSSITGMKVDDLIKTYSEPYADARGKHEDMSSYMNNPQFIAANRTSRATYNPANIISVTNKATPAVTVGTSYSPPLGNTITSGTIIAGDETGDITKTWNKELSNIANIGRLKLKGYITDGSGNIVNINEKGKVILPTGTSIIGDAIRTIRGIEKEPEGIPATNVDISTVLTGNDYINKYYIDPTTQESEIILVDANGTNRSVPSYSYNKVDGYNEILMTFIDKDTKIPYTIHTPILRKPEGNAGALPQLYDYLNTPESVVNAKVIHGYNTKEPTVFTQKVINKTTNEVTHEPIVESKMINGVYTYVAATDITQNNIIVIAKGTPISPDEIDRILSILPIEENRIR